MARPTDETPITKSAPEARQGTTGHNVRWVLGFGVGGAVVALAIVYLWFFSA
ncbi:hypothetical protein PQJ75_14435 [Rhodoplanes sp. TEM]|uniref:Uncharacterized protein n=1 Tax=Rhodoplanes tepidamans TaxID=200616 RepID=A0ABT5JD26_RHOTP|nr:MULTISPECIES: hypothetical protein [Rhodoplanes]MDC7787576.1 hypothetical protein [Rhodoplanes tepidamans]MDC7984931.1 hypothetical protein [Rhodoplanes sp. TEM]MDQ0358004.1 hypothetical protein [Rhodoplanes tepidamans]